VLRALARSLSFAALLCSTAALSGCPSHSCEEVAAHIYDECGYTGPTDDQREDEAEDDADAGVEDGGASEEPLDDDVLPVKREDFLAQCESPDPDAPFAIPDFILGIGRDGVLNASCDDINQDGKVSFNQE